MSKSKLILIIVIIAIVSVVYALDLTQYFTLEYIKSQQDVFVEMYHQSPVVVISAFMTVYIAVTALSLPLATVLTLLAGALFGTVLGTVLASFASTIGASLAFLAARFLFQNSLQAKYKKQLLAVNKGIEKEGAFYLFSMRLIPIFPFFLINITMGLTKMPIWKFYWVSQLGMLAGTAVYVYAGTQLAQIESLAGILSPKLLLAFVLLGIFPLLAKKILGVVKSSLNKSNKSESH